MKRREERGAMIMLEFLQTGKGIYVLAAICLISLAGKLAAGSFYKRLIKETGNMMLTKNKWLRELRQRAEDTFRLNQGVANTRVFVERQVYDARVGFLTPGGWNAFSGEMTALCFLTGGAAAFLSYWYRCDSYYIILYSSVGALTGIFNIMVDLGCGLEDKRQRLCVSIQDYLENSLWKRLGRDRLPDLDEEKSGLDAAQAAVSREPARLFRGRKRENAAYSGKAGGMNGQNGGAEVKNGGSSSRVRSIRDGAGSRTRMQSREEEDADKIVSDEALNQLRKSLEQAAAGRTAVRSQEKAEGGGAGTSAGENWMKDLKPEEIRVLGEIIREYLG